MITAVDSNVLLDVFAADPEHGVASREALRRSIAEGGLIACEVVWSEVSSFFPSTDEAAEAMDRLGVRFDPLTLDAALWAGAAWRDYRARGGRRARVVADFLIGAHSELQAERLLTRDRGFYRSYFQSLEILAPSG